MSHATAHLGQIDVFDEISQLGLQADISVELTSAQNSVLPPVLIQDLAQGRSGNAAAWIPRSNALCLVLDIEFRTCLHGDECQIILQSLEAAMKGSEVCELTLADREPY